MVKESARKCSHCGNNGHNSRTCCNGKGGGCVKLFGVNILAEKKEEDFMRKCKSMGNLAACHGEITAADDGYLSDDPGRSRRAHERKKGKSIDLNIFWMGSLFFCMFLVCFTWNLLIVSEINGFGHCSYLGFSDFIFGLQL